ncbi:MAG: glycine--tRNA ligase subunit beta [Deltaproteobacteria bacterium]|nr:glycine--tRNA ligase subunit beta [Deltaproteobacteria bacterium]MBW2595455.1 glycine--tRNA ligase subunit beta [Deltaproteobacteria bacterium]
MAKELLLEIGTEEIPAAFMPKVLKDMEKIITREFSENRIGHGLIKTMGTPRRLLLSVEGVDERQEDQLLEKMGPSTKMAFDEEGKPTKAAIGFARGQGVDVSELEIIETPKGKQICSRKKIIGEDTKILLTDLLPRFILSIPFRKSMRWMDLDIRFARPVHWILALFGDEIIPFSIENIASGSTSRGHRFMAPEPFEVNGLEDYIEKIKERFVVVDPGERKNIILDESEKAAKDVSGFVFKNEELLDEVSFLVEYPSVVCGSFDREYLGLPKEVLTTTMMKHQKYFPVVDAHGDLLPYFITVNNTLARDPSVVARGNEKVIRARLADARFFFEEDQKIPLEDRLEDLKNVVFHSLLGTSYEKVMRFKNLASYIAQKINPQITQPVDRVALLCKADLETRMVCEFAELQGVMGREYALIQGEDPIVAKAIYEHYMPVSAGGELPETDEGAIVSIADKMDTIAGCFGVGLIPTGTADPYALRRQALGIINIIINKDYRLELDRLVDESLSILEGKLKRTPEETKSDVMNFLKGRFENQLISQGYSYDVVDAVLSPGISDIVQSMRKIEAMEAFKKHPDFEPLAIAFKRVVNILKDFEGGSVDTAVFDSSAETNLYHTFADIRERANGCIDEGRYADALSEMASLRKPVDTFFDEVMVMAEDEKIRFNRLSLLEEISKLFHRIADFSKIVTEG